MNDIFLSYSSKDRPRVQLIRDALVERGFSVFWDQEVPSSTDWDTWIRQQLAESGCTLVAWSRNSVASDNVRHEAFIAKQVNKMVPVLLDALGAAEFPMGFYAVQATNLCSWAGDVTDKEWAELLTQLESRLMPNWMKRTIDAMEAELVGERARRETAERRDRTLRDQIAKEADARQQARAELEQAQDEVARLRESAQSLTTDAEAATARSKGLLEQLQLAGEQQRALEAAKEEALARVSALERTLTESKASPPARRSTTGAESKREETDLLQKSPANTPPGMSPAAERTRGFESSPQSGRTRIDGKSNRQEDEFEERWKAWKAKGEGNTRHPLALLGLIAAIIVALVLVLSR